MALPVTVAGVKSHLVGLGPWLTAAAANEGYDDAAILRSLPAKIRDFERKSRFRVTDLQVSTKPDGAFPAVSPRRLREEDPYDYFANQVGAYFTLTLNERPVRQVQRLRICLGDITLFEIPTHWISLKKRAGTIHLLPTSGALYVAGVSAAFAAFGMAFGSMDYLPNAIQVDYLAGLPGGWAQDGIGGDYADVLRALEEHCAWGVLDDIAQLPDAGLSGVGMSGGSGSENFSYTRFADRKAELEKSVMEFAQSLKDTETPLLMAFIG